MELGDAGILKFPFREENCSVHIVRLVDGMNPGDTKLVCDGICERNVEPTVQESFRQFGAGAPLDATSQALFGRAPLRTVAEPKREKRFESRFSVDDGASTTIQGVHPTAFGPTSVQFKMMVAPNVPA